MGIRPKLRPKDEEFDKIVAAANSGGGDDKPASGGKGGGKSVNPLAKEGSADYKKMQKANAPDSFYGYYDQNTGDYVPWYIDMINGGGANQAGPQFEGGFGAARLAGGLLNAAGVSPYGQDRARPFMPMEAFRGGDDVPLRQAPLAAAPTGGGAGGGAGGGVIDAVLPKPDQRNMDIVDAYNRSQADAGALAALMSDRYDGTILAPGAGGLRNRNMGDPRNFAPNTQPTTLTPAQRGVLGDRFDPRVQGGANPAMAMVPTGMPTLPGSGQLIRGLPLQSNVYTKQGYAQRPPYVQTDRGMDLPPDVAMSRAMQALRLRFPNATPEQLANAAAMMGM